jgi:hypothetical protein
MTRSTSAQQPVACMVLVVPPADLSSKEVVDHLQSVLKAYGKVVSIQAHATGFVIVTMASSVQAGSVVSAAARGAELLVGYRICAHKPLLDRDYLASTLRQDEEVAYKAAGIMPWTIRNVDGVLKACVLVGSEIRDETCTLVLNFIAGKREKEDAQAACTAAREFWEETGSRVPLEGMKAWASLLAASAETSVPAAARNTITVHGAGDTDSTITSLAEGVASMSLASGREARSARSSPLFDGTYSHALPDGAPASALWLCAAKMALYVIPYESLVGACGGLDVVELHADKTAKEHTVVPDVMASLHWIPIDSFTEFGATTMVDEAGTELVPGKFLQGARKWKVLQSHLRALAHLPPLEPVPRVAATSSRIDAAPEGGGVTGASTITAVVSTGEATAATTNTSTSTRAAVVERGATDTIEGDASTAAVPKRPTRLVPTRAGREVLRSVKPTTTTTSRDI